MIIRIAITDRVVIYGILLLLILLNILCTGCTLIPRNSHEVGSGSTIYPPSTIRAPKMDYRGITGLLLISFAISVTVALYGFRKAGGAAAGGSLAALFLTRGMESAIVYWSAGFVVAGVGILLMISMFVRNRALKEVIHGVQKYKDELSPAYGVVRECLIDELHKQSPETKKIVKQIKKELKK